jgi:hypothetical protein
MDGTDVVFHPLAVREYWAAVAWYEGVSQRTATRFRQAVVRATERIKTSFESLGTITKPYRYARISGYPYILVVRRLDAATFFVTAVAHTSRRPNYWSRRHPR